MFCKESRRCERNYRIPAAALVPCSSWEDEQHWALRLPSVSSAKGKIFEGFTSPEPRNLPVAARRSPERPRLDLQELHTGPLARWLAA